MMKNRLTQLPFIARAVRCGLKRLGKTLAGRRDDLRRAPARRPPRTRHDEAETMNLLGLLCLRSRGVTRDYAQARYWFQRAAAAGSAVAMHNLGAMYEHGHGVAEDYAQARGWYRRAAEASHAPAAERLYRLPGRVEAPNGRVPAVDALGCRLQVSHRLTPVIDQKIAAFVGSMGCARAVSMSSLA
jgi:TPR repeat protein